MLIHVLDALKKASIAGYCWGGGLLEFWSIHYCMEGGGCYYSFVMIWVHVFLYPWLDKTWNLQFFLNWKLKKYLHLWWNEKCVLHSVMFGILTSVHIILSILFDRNIWPSFILVHSYKVSFYVFWIFLKGKCNCWRLCKHLSKEIFIRECQLTKASFWLVKMV